jgi:hypothetical protein
MDPFEPIRSRAAALHNELVSEGIDPFDPLAWVQAAVARRRLELVWLPRGDPGLKSARALYDEQGGTICCEEEAESVARALLVAHELGHSELHAGFATCAGSDIDPSRSTGSAPVGLQRVEDYGARERRELQANVYARELVLPGAAGATAPVLGPTLSAVKERSIDAGNFQCRQSHELLRGRPSGASEERVGLSIQLGHTSFKGGSALKGVIMSRKPGDLPTIAARCRTRYRRPRKARLAIIQLHASGPGRPSSAKRWDDCK